MTIYYEVVNLFKYIELNSLLAEGNACYLQIKVPSGDTVHECRKNARKNECVRHFVK